jgi:ComF family protein
MHRLHCTVSVPAVVRARSAGLYEGRLRDIIHAFKYGRRRSLAASLAALMRTTGAVLLNGADAVVAVPLHPSRRRERGFNQAHDLARRLDLPVVRALRRVRATHPQAMLPAAERHGNVRHAFVARRQARRLLNTVVVVVDDVMTTGATLGACALALKQAGVREVRALTAARVVTTLP